MQRPSLTTLTKVPLLQVFCMCHGSIELSLQRFLLPAKLWHLLHLQHSLSLMLAVFLTCHKDTDRTECTIDKIPSTEDKLSLRAHQNSQTLLLLDLHTSVPDLRAFENVEC
jgi:hypothetical protein